VPARCSALAPPSVRIGTPAQSASIEVVWPFCDEQGHGPKETNGPGERG
jgi:hypothetical protein